MDTNEHHHVTHLNPEEICGGCGCLVHVCDCGWVGCVFEDDDEARFHRQVARDAAEREEDA